MQDVIPPSDARIEHRVYVSLKEYLDALLKEKDRLLDIRVAEIYRIMDKSDEGFTARLDVMNKFREAMKDQASACLTRIEYDAKHGAICNEIKLLKENDDINRGKASQTSVNVAYAIALLGMVVSIWLHFVK